jgi:Arc/MetJ family transcription regulator
MRTTLEIKPELIKQAQKFTKLKTKKAVINYALEQIIKKEQISKIKAYKGKVDLEIKIKELRKNRCKF